ncbi:hypothetical protein [Streptomyces cucumeris]|uniref:hypothetical protein n=1 Tax=Streptomyces cucumeris TaxID=2962890 RepID=UPI003D7180DB
MNPVSDVRPSSPSPDPSVKAASVKAASVKAASVKGDIDTGRLVSLLADAGHTVTVTRSGEGPAAPEDAAATAVFDARDHTGPDPTWWAASEFLRRARRVPDADACGSPGLEDVLRTGEWSHPSAGAVTPVPVDGVVVFKPGVRVLPETLRALADRLAECGYRATRARLLSGTRIRDEDLASHHYLPHVDLADRGELSVHERARFLRLYDTPAFTERFGERADAVAVLPARAVTEDLGVPPALLDEWSERSTLRWGLDSGAPDGPNGVGDCLYLNVFQDPGRHGGRPFVVLNPHLPGVLAQLRDSAHQALAILVEAHSRTPLPWDRMRREFCGVTDPERALPGSLRGDARAGALALRNADGTPVRRTNNGVHLSNGAVEALQDATTWFGLRPGDTTAGGRLRETGLHPERVLRSAFVSLAGRRRAVQEVTDGLRAQDAAAALRGGRLMEHCDGWDDMRSRELVDIAWRFTAGPRRDPEVVAVFLHGSAGRGRTSTRSGIDLLIVRDTAPSAPPVDTGAGTATAEGVPVRVRTIGVADARRAATEAPADPAALGTVAALAGVVLWDRGGMGEELRAAAVRLPVPAALREAELARVEELLHTAPQDTDALREASLRLAGLALDLHPLRRHHRRWALTDLDRAAEGGLRDLLAEVWAVGGAGDTELREARRLVRDVLGVTIGHARPGSPEEELFRLRVAGWSAAEAPAGSLARAARRRLLDDLGGGRRRETAAALAEAGEELRHRDRTEPHG